MVKESLLHIESLAGRIYLIRGERVMVDSDLAELYGFETKNLNKAVTRNRQRFPDDFMFRLTKEEWDSLRFQIGTSNRGRGGRDQQISVLMKHVKALLQPSDPPKKRSLGFQLPREISSDDGNDTESRS